LPSPPIHGEVPHRMWCGSGSRTHDVAWWSSGGDRSHAGRGNVSSCPKATLARPTRNDAGSRRRREAILPNLRSCGGRVTPDRRSTGSSGATRGGVPSQAGAEHDGTANCGRLPAARRSDRGLKPTRMFPKVGFEETEAVSMRNRGAEGQGDFRGPISILVRVMPSPRRGPALHLGPGSGRERRTNSTCE